MCTPEGGVLVMVNHWGRNVIYFKVSYEFHSCAFTHVTLLMDFALFSDGETVKKNKYADLIKVLSENVLNN